MKDLMEERMLLNETEGRVTVTVLPRTLSRAKGNTMFEATENQAEVVHQRTNVQWTSRDAGVETS
jgi:hypothetical protein